ncbi:hypothetical protein [Paenibacillus sp. Marseille-Q7038]
MFGYMKEFAEHYTMLLQNTNFTSADQSVSPSYEFTYQHSNDPHLSRLREQYHLNEVAGTGDEISQIINLMKWVNQRLMHGNEPPSKLVHALSVLELTEHTDMKVNCYVIATVLTEVYLSLGYPARRIHCGSYDAYDLDSYVVTAVYSYQLGKWLYMDASWGVYVTDLEGILLSPEEFRNHMASNVPLIIYSREKNEGWSDFYKGYMAKEKKEFCALVPEHYDPFELTTESPYRFSVNVTSENAIFWRAPRV